MLKTEIPYFYIDGDYGFDQDKFENIIMRGGGCAAVTACDCCVYLKKYKGYGKLFRGDTDEITKRDYIALANKMKPFLHPRITGIDKTDIYIDGFNGYLKSVGESGLDLTGFENSLGAEQAKAAIKKQLDCGFPVPYLMLKHKNPRLKDYVWHWFIIGGYEEFGGDFAVKIISYGNWFWIDFAELYNTGYSATGGMILFSER